MLWSNPKHRSKRIAPSHIWRYTLQAGVYDIEKFSILLEDKLGAHEDVFDERRPIGQARLFDLAFHDDGYLRPLFATWRVGYIDSRGQVLSDKKPEPTAGKMACPIPPDTSDGMMMRGERRDDTNQKVFH